MFKFVNVFTVSCYWHSADDIRLVYHKYVKISVTLDYSNVRFEIYKS